MMPLLLMIFYLKLIGKILVTVLFVIKLQKLLLTFFCNCDIVKLNWEALVQVIKAKHDIDFDLSTFDKLFGVHLDKYIMFICLCLKYYTYVSC